MDDEFTEEVDSGPEGSTGIGGRPRSYHRSGRMLRLNARFSEQERAEIEVAAAAIGMTATGFAAEAALLAARGTPMTLDATVAQRETFARLQRQLFEARTAVNRFGNLVNQAVAALHATGPAADRGPGPCDWRCARGRCATWTGWSMSCTGGCGDPTGQRSRHPGRRSAALPVRAGQTQ